MNILHLTNDFAGSSVYKNLVRAIDVLGIKQTIYCPVRSPEIIGKNKIPFINSESRIIYSYVLNNYTRINFFRKRNKLYNDLVLKIPKIEQFDVIHAHTWYSDGAIALELHKKIGIPYIITIRNTDLNLFFKYMLHLRKLGYEILKNAKKIIFISAVYSERFNNHRILLKKYKQLEHKTEIIPNGIDSFWINYVGNRKIQTGIPVNLLYIGNFNRNKNIWNLIKAVKLLNKDIVEYKLELVGNGKIFKDIKKQNLNTEWIKFHGEVTDKNYLRQLFQNCDIFTMPSRTETFGLVYIEALSQGIPIIYTKGEGIDGFYKNIGEATDANDIINIAEGINNIRINYSAYNFNPSDIIKNHNWVSISKKYANIYKNLTN